LTPFSPNFFTCRKPCLPGELWSPEDQSLEALLKEFHQIISTTHAPEHQLTTTTRGDQLTDTKEDQLNQGDQLTSTTVADELISSPVSRHTANGKEKNCM
jgi:hypothetical protein